MKNHVNNLHLKVIIQFGMSGFMTGAAFMQPALWPLVFVSNVPVCCFLMKASNDRIKQCYLTMIFSYSIMYYAPMMYWLYYLKAVIPLQEEVSVFVLTIGIGFIVLQNGASFFIAFLPYRFYKTNSAMDAILLSACYMLAEWIQQYAGVVPFPWARLGLIVTPCLPFIQSASLFGVFFVTFLVFMVNGLIASILILIKKGIERYDKLIHLHQTDKKTVEMKKAYIQNLAVTVGIAVILGCNLCFGAVSIRREQQADKLQPKTGVLLVQGNHSGLSKTDVSVNDMVEDYLMMTKQALTPDTKLVVWPETSIPIAMWSPILSGETLSTVLGQFCEKNGVEMIIGAYDHQYEKEVYLTYNAMYYVTADGAQKQAYYKQKLVPFGEYLPYKTMLSKLFPDTVEAVSSELNDEPGRETIVMKTESGEIGGIICYESIFPEIARQSVMRGAKLFALISNDSWFGQSSALQQHHSQAVMRAVESRRYILRASNTGITSIIASTGEILKQVPSDIPAVISGEAVIKDQVTLFSRTGHIIVIPVIFFWMGGLVKWMRQRFVGRITHR